MNFLFFILPLLLFVGIAVQGVAFYSILLILPCALFISKKLVIPNYMKSIAICFLSLHLVFPIFNFLNYIFKNKVLSHFTYTIQLTWPGILQSDFPSSMFFTGITLFLLYKFAKKKAVPSKKVYFQHLNPAKFFLLGLFFFSIIFLFILIYQHHIGIDLRSILRDHVSYLKNNDQFDNGRYRVYGFYGHPLTAAGVLLCYSVFSWSLFWAWLVNIKNNNYSFLPFSSIKWLSGIIIVTPVFTCLAGLIMTGGRTAFAAAIIILIFTPFYFGVKKYKILATITIIGLILSAFFVANQTGIIDRISYVTSSIQKTDSLETGNNRIYFWKTYTHMFLDKPIIGQGNYWIASGIRDQYYDKLGYGDLSQKYPAHNNYLEILGSVGIIGFLWILYNALKLFNIFKQKVLEPGSELRIILPCLILAVTANLIHATTQNVFFDSSVEYSYMSLLMIFAWQAAFRSKNNEPVDANK